MVVHTLLHVLRGFAMGSADIVPGVSGGTIALVLGIYERFIASLRAGSKALTLLVRGDVAGFRQWMLAVEWAFIIPLLVGIGVAFLTLARVIRDLLQDQPELMSAIFLGLVAGSVIIAWRLIRAPLALHAALIAIVAVATFVALGLAHGTSEESVGQLAEPALWAFFGAGAIAICAMVLPGVSGSFLLVVMGMYGPALTALTELQILNLLAFAAGVVVGLALFSQLLHLALQRYHDLMMAILIGLMAGSVRVLWPWPGGVESTDLGAPTGDWIVAVGLAVVAFVAVVVVGAYAQRLEAAEEAEGAGPDEPDEPDAAQSGQAKPTGAAAE
jgi:putative membrane protein